MEVAADLLADELKAPSPPHLRPSHRLQTLSVSLHLPQCSEGPPATTDPPPNPPNPPLHRSPAQRSLQHTQPFRRSEDRDKARASSSHSELRVSSFCFQQFGLSKSKLERLGADRGAARLSQASLVFKAPVEQAAVRLQLLIWTFCFCAEQRLGGGSHQMLLSV